MDRRNFARLADVGAVPEGLQGPDHPDVSITLRKAVAAITALAERPDASIALACDNFGDGESASMPGAFAVVA